MHCRFCTFAFVVYAFKLWLHRSANIGLPYFSIVFIIRFMYQLFTVATFIFFRTTFHSPQISWWSCCSVRVKKLLSNMSVTAVTGKPPLPAGPKPLEKLPMRPGRVKSPDRQPIMTSQQETMSDGSKSWPDACESICSQLPVCLWIWEKS